MTLKSVQGRSSKAEMIRQAFMNCDRVLSQAPPPIGTHVILHADSWVLTSPKGLEWLRAMLPKAVLEVERVRVVER